MLQKPFFSISVVATCLFVAGAWVQCATQPVFASDMKSMSTVVTKTTTVAWVVPGIYNVKHKLSLNEQSMLVMNWLLRGIRSFSQSPLVQSTIAPSIHTAAPLSNSWSAFRASMRRGGGGSGNNPTDDSGAENSQSSLLTPAINVNNVTKDYGDDDFSLSPSSDSSGTFSFSSSNTDVVTVDADGIVTVVGAGTATITITQAANGSYTSGNTTATVTVNGTTAPTITFNSFSHDRLDTDAFEPPISSNSSGAFTYVSSNESIVTSNGTSLNIIDNTSGATVIITATQAPSGIYTSGSATGTLTLVTVIDQCATLAPCNGGTCTRVSSVPDGPLDSYECSNCPDPFVGPTCTDRTNNCEDEEGVTCSNNGTCDADPSGGTCICNECYTGDYCQLDDLACA